MSDQRDGLDQGPDDQQPSGREPVDRQPYRDQIAPPAPGGRSGSGPYAAVRPTPIPFAEDGTPPLWAPWYGAGPLDAVARAWRKYARFDGRASRSEYWWWALGNAVAYVLIVALGVVITATTRTTDAYGVTTPGSVWLAVPGILFVGWWLATIVPGLALLVRRLHDGGLVGWFVFVAFLPFGSIAVLVMTILESKPEGARFDRPST
ncbi:DUF805 domain-containing protein [Curtobacterium sp. RRHDQ10]|uniref:DUF805 domain-containing protein n=1 Tax=Curtobacterium phyllosphaerae TaxID=3413379 RepID=UPI003BEF8AF3